MSSRTEITYLILDEKVEEKIAVSQREICTDPNCNCMGSWGHIQIEDEDYQNELIKKSKTHRYESI